MKVIGFSAGVTGRDSNVDRMVKAILDKSGHATEFVKLTDLTFSGCKGCADLCAPPRVCQLDDDLLPYYQKVLEADAVVVGSPVYFGTINALTLAFIERFFGYRHVACAIKGKPFVLAVALGGLAEKATKHFKERLAPFEVNVLDVVTYQSGVPPCFVCGRHKVCTIGGLYQIMGDAAHTLDVTPEMFRAWEDNPATVAAIDAAADTLTRL